MKKYILVLLLCLLVTGCFGKKGTGNLEVICEKEELSYNIKEVDTFNFEYYKGTVNKVILSIYYEGDNMSKAIDAYKLAYSTYEGIDVTSEYNKIIYTFDVSKLSDDVKRTFNIKNTYNEQIKELDSIGYTCKDK